MNKILNILLFAALTLFAASCGDDGTRTFTNGEVYPPEGILQPFDNDSLPLQTGAGIATTFSWKPGSCDDGLPVQYELVFYMNGTAIDTIDAGYNTSVALTHKAINLMLVQAGVGRGEKVTVQWTATANSGIKHAVCAEKHSLEITSLLSILNPPKTLYLVGTGTEMAANAADAATALAFRTTADGEYELYTRLGAGNYLVVDYESDPPRGFTLDGGNITPTDGVTPVNNELGNGIRRLIVDFTIGASEVSNEITKVTYFKTDRNATGETEMTYNGHGEWKIIGLLNEAADWWADASVWGERDDRYRFRAYYGSTLQEWGRAGGSEVPASLTDAASLTIAPGKGDNFKWPPALWVCKLDLYVNMLAPAGKPMIRFENSEPQPHP